MMNALVHSNLEGLSDLRHGDAHPVHLLTM